MATLNCGCHDGPWWGINPPPRCQFHRDLSARSLPSVPSIRPPASREWAEAQRALAEANELRGASGTLAGLSFESAAALAILKLSDRAANALANDEMAEHDLLQESIELLHEAMRTAERARASRSGGG